MRILFVIESGVPYGSNKSLIEVVQQLKRLGFEIAVAGKGAGVMKNWVESFGVRYFSVGIDFLLYPRSDTFLRKVFFPLLLGRRLLLNFISFLRLAVLCVRMRPTLIHTNVGPISVGYFVARIFGIRHIWHLREFQDLDFGMRFLPSRDAFLSRLKRSDAVVCVSLAVARHFGLGRETVIYNGVGNRTDVPEILMKEKYFLFVGSLQSTKGIEEVLRAFTEFRRRDVGNEDFRLLIIGSGRKAYVERLKSLVFEQLESEKIEFLGYRSDATSWMKKAKAVLVASKSEAFGRVTAEAMFNGSLIVGKNSSGTAELLEEWRGAPVGLKFDDHESLVSRLSDVLTMDDATYREIVCNAQDKAAELFSNEESARKIVDVYHRLVN